MKKRSPGGCSSFLFLLFVAFLALRVAGVVDWSWWWVTSPLWLPVAFVLAILAVMAVMGVGIYKVVASVLRGAQPTDSTRQPEAPRSDVLDAQGTEVTRSARERSGTRALPAPASAEPGDEGPADTHPPE